MWDYILEHGIVIDQIEPDDLRARENTAANEIREFCDLAEKEVTNGNANNA